MSNYPPGVTDADTDRYFGDPDLDRFLDNEREAAYRARYEEALDRQRAAWEDAQERDEDQDEEDGE